VTQDLAPLRKLEGERRLLQYDPPAAPLRSACRPGCPEWVRDDRVVEDIDADAMLETGVHPSARCASPRPRFRRGRWCGSRALSAPCR